MLTFFKLLFKTHSFNKEKKYLKFYDIRKKTSTIDKKKKKSIETNYFMKNSE